MRIAACLALHYRAFMHVGRNDPCPCGSGKKFKKCCIDEKTDLERAALLHVLDNEIVLRALKYAHDTVPDWDPWLDLGEAGEDNMVQLHAPIAAYMLPAIDDETPADLLADLDLAPREQLYLAAQRRAWLSVWEIESVVAGASMTLVDRLTGERRTMTERKGARPELRRMLLLGRVVDFEGLSIVVGMHPRPLPPRGGETCALAFRKEMAKGGLIAPSVLRDPDNVLAMINAWDHVIEMMDEEDRDFDPAAMLRNTDGEAFAVVKQHFVLSAAISHEHAFEALSRIEGALVQDDEVMFIRGQPGEPGNTVLGHLRREEKGYVLETNSVARADALMPTIAGAGLVAGQRTVEDTSAPLPDPSPDERAMMRDIVEHHYATWPDVPLPALNGKTPRQAMRSKRGRAEVELIIKEMEQHEARAPQDEQFDFGHLRKALGF